MASDATIIVGSLNDKELRNAIDNLVKMVDDKMLEAAQSFDAGISLMEQSLRRFSTNAATTVNDIKQAFTKLGTTFDDFAKAMSKATAAASGGGRGTGGGAGGSGSSGGSGGGGTSPAANTIGALKEEIRLQQKKVDEQVRGTAELQIEVNQHEKLKKQLKDETKSTEQSNKELAKKLTSGAMSMPANSIAQAEAKLRQLEFVANRYQGKGILDSTQWNRLQNAIDKTKQKIESLKNAQPPTMKQVLGMDESSVEAVSRKMAALKRIRVDTANPVEAKKLGDEYQRLSRLQAEMLGKNIQLRHSNNYLAQSFGYIRNRIVYAFTLGAITNFTKQLYEVRGAYEMLERSLGILVNDMERGTQIFNELNEMALKSPFTLIELGTAAKQLTAYNFTAEEVVDTTRRLADISAALGVPMERLTYNLGQIKAQGVLNARDARDFANAGLAIVPMLAQMYNETKRFGDQQVTTAQVYDMMSKKMVTYRDVLNVIYRITDEGGKFFDFQAKQAGTLRVQIANLSLAYNNMLNDIGKEHQDALAMPLKTMRWVFQNWREIYKAIEAVIAILGIYKAQALVAFTVTKIMALVAAYQRLGGIIGIVTTAFRTLSAAMIANPMGAIAAAVAALASGFIFFGNSVEEASEDVKMFGDNAVKTIHDVDTYLKILNGVDEKSNTYKQTIEKLNEVLRDYGIETIKEGENLDNINARREKTIALIKEEGAERQYANQIAAGNEKFNKRVEDANQKLLSELQNAVTAKLGAFVDLDDVQKNADAIQQIVAQIVQENISLITNKTAEEYKKGVSEIFKKIQAEMKDIVPEEVGETWVSSSGFFYHNNIIKEYIETINGAYEANDAYMGQMEHFHKKGIAAAKSTMTLTEKINAYDRALQNPTNDTYALYNSIARLVKDFAKTHNIDFNVRFHAQVPPEWMRAKDLPELQALARRFAAIAQANPNGANVNGTRFTSEELWDRAYNYAQVAKEKEDALQGEEAREKQRQKEAEKERKKQEQAARQAAAAEKKRQREAAAQQKRDEDMVAKALKDEISLIKEMQGNYDKLRKAGLTNTQALDIATQGYERTIQGINAQLTKFGITAFDAKDFAGKDVNELLTSLKSQLNTLMSSGKVKRDSVKTLELEIQKLTVEAKTYNLKKVTDGLNNELAKLKDEYELAVEMDANPELGGMFKEMFDIDTSEMPHSIDEYMARVQNAFDSMSSQLGYGALFADVWTTTEEELRKWGETVGMDASKVEELVKTLNQAQGVAKKWAQDVVKQTQDLEYKLADTNGKIAIEEKKLQALRQRLAEETNEKQKHLLELQIKDQEDAIARLRDELFQLLPTYEALFGGIAEHSAAMTRKLAKQLKSMLENAQAIGNDNFLVTDPRGGTATITKKQRGQYLDKVNKELLKSQTVVQKLKEAFTEGEDGLIDYAQGIEYISEELKKLSELVNTIGDITTALGLSEDGQEAIGDFANALAGLGQAAEGYVKIQSGDIIGGATDIIKGTWTAISTWFDNSDKKITRKIEESKRAVQELELAYKDLQYAVENSLGSAEILARRSTLANKQLQLQEKERQLELEKSRKKKNRDEDAIRSLQGEIADLKNEIKSLTSDVANMLLGGDIKSAAEDFVSTWVNAWRQGGDTMDALEGKFDSMIDTMIAKSLAAKVVAKRLQPIYDIIDTITGTESDDEMQAKLKEIKDFIGNGNFAEDIDSFLTMLYGYLGISAGSGGKNLSALQQGIQSITEDTAGALEGYMNGVSQQVYLQSDLLTQIRDAVVTLDNDVTMATQAQMLLQLQNNYILMQTMASLMNGWTTPSGQGIRVELIN